MLETSSCALPPWSQKTGPSRHEDRSGACRGTQGLFDAAVPSDIPAQPQGGWRSPQLQLHRRLHGTSRYVCCSLKFEHMLTSSTGICNLHGYGALKVGWNEYISKLYRQPDSEYKMKRMLYRGGTSGNPYIKEQYMEISTMLKPRKAAIAIMELREHIASEWQKDLQLVARENAEHWRHHLAKVQHNGTDPELHKQHRLLITTDDDSALRIDNYDLLIKFCTHIACEQVMEELATSPKDEHAAIWLKEYMQTRGARSFGAVQTRRVGWNFLNDILNEPPRVISGTGRDADTLCLIDPLDMGARIMAQRQNVAECWLEILHEIKDDNLSIHRKFMEDCMKTVLTDFWKNN
eukprot:754904-Hanusia_phi.AAC.2